MLRLGFGLFWTHSKVTGVPTDGYVLYLGKLAKGGGASVGRTFRDPPSLYLVFDHVCLTSTVRRRPPRGPVWPGDPVQATDEVALGPPGRGPHTA